jgi:hypothetical protein
MDIFSLNERIETIKATQLEVMSTFENGYSGEEGVYPDLPNAEAYDYVVGYTDMLVYALEELQAQASEFLIFLNDYTNGLYTDG